MSTKLDLYRIFCEVAKNKSFSKAAKELFMTQPAVSQAIMNLERDLDIRLFTRTSKGVYNIGALVCGEWFAIKDIAWQMDLFFHYFPLGR